MAHGRDNQVGPDREQLIGDLPFEIIHDADWDLSHLTFRQSDGCIFRVPKKELIHVKHDDGEEKMRPDQPPHFYGVVFADHLWFFRGIDGYWYRCGYKPKKEKRWLWADLWDKYGPAAKVVKVLKPTDFDQVTVEIQSEGPIGECTIPDMSTGEPQPGYIANVLDDGTLVITDVRTDTGSMLFDPMQLISIVGLYFRTAVKRGQENDDDTGDSEPG